MANDFDLIVIGSGSAARAVVYPCREAGWSVAMVDARPFGGTCALRGCDPKKILIGAAEIVDRAEAMRGRGVEGGASINWAELAAFKRTFTDPFPVNMRHALEKAGIEALEGVATFTGPGSLEVAGRPVSARQIVIAAGGAATPLGIPGEEFSVTSDEFLDLAALPRRIVFIGGGYISFEFAHLAARAGAQVAILHRGERPLEGFDADLVAKLSEYTRKIGIDLRLKVKVTAIERVPTGLAVVAESGGAPVRVEADLVVRAAGRRPNLAPLQPERGGVAYSAHGILVNDYLQNTSNPNVWAAGDVAVTPLPRLTPVASMEGAVVVHNLLHAERRAYDKSPVPSVVFTIPPLASVGLTGLEAERHPTAKSRFFDTSNWYTSRRVGETCSAAKVIVDTATDRILGAHLLGHGAEETINVFAIAMRCGMPASELKSALLTYPTKTSDIDYLL